MFLIKQILILLFALLTEINSLQNVATKTTFPTIVLNSNSNSSIKQKVTNANSSITQKAQEPILIAAPSSSDSTADEIKNEVSVNVLLETPNASVAVEELHQGPHYELNWAFIDKDTIRVTFDLFSVPSTLIENLIKSNSDERKYNLLATMTTMPSRSLKAITTLQYFLFIIRPYHKNREIIMKMEKLVLKNTTLRPYDHFSNVLRLTSLNHREKYSVCICYYQKDTSTNTPDLLLCQDIINDYSKFSELPTDPKHGLLFITTQYSIIIGLLIVLQSVFTIRKRRIAQIFRQHLTTTAHSIRTTLSSVSLVRHSFSSLDTAAEQQQHATNGHASRRESTIHEDVGMKKRNTSSPAIVISEPSVTIHHDATNSDETEPFLKQGLSKNHVHFLLGPGEGSDEDFDNEHEDNANNTALNLQTVSTNREPYGDQADALLSMAHILDTNKPWSRHGHNTSPV